MLTILLSIYLAGIIVAALVGLFSAVACNWNSGYRPDPCKPGEDRKLWRLRNTPWMYLSDAERQLVMPGYVPDKRDDR